MTNIEKRVGEDADLMAQIVHTEAYLRSGLISDSDLDEFGLYSDEYTARAEHILVLTEEKGATMRMIHADKREGVLSLPTAKHFSIDPETVMRVAHVSRLSNLKPKHVVEISGLGAVSLGNELTGQEQVDATRQLYATGLRRSLDQGHKMWIMNAEKKDVITFLNLVLGKDSYAVLGDPQVYDKYLGGAETVPIALNPQDLVEKILTAESGRFKDQNIADILLAMQGVSEKHLSPRLKELFGEYGIEMNKQTRMDKIASDPARVLYTGIIGYSALRALSLVGVEEFNGSIPEFIELDVSTAVTQVASMELYFKAEKRGVRALGALGAAASFAAPYAYFWANGEDYPWYVNAIAGGMIAFGVGLEVDKTVRDKNAASRLSKLDMPSTTS